MLTKQVRGRSEKPQRRRRPLRRRLCASSRCGVVAATLLLRGSTGAVVSSESEDDAVLFTVDENATRLIATRRFKSEFRFIDTTTGENATLSEVSACRFVPGSDETAVLVGDGGDLFVASRIRLSNRNETEDDELKTLDVELSRHVSLEPVAGYDRVDAEGAAFFHPVDEADSLLYVSTEKHSWENGSASPLGAWAYDIETGQPLTESSHSFKQPPDLFESRVSDNAGFEALTATYAIVVGNDDDDEQTPPRLVTTTEDALIGDPDDLRRVVAWSGGSDLPDWTAVYYASRTKDGRALGVVEFESLSTTLLALERDKSKLDDGSRVYTVRLFEVAFTETATTLILNGTETHFNATASKKLLFEWDTEESPLLPGDDESLWNVAVDNYEAMCLFPNATVFADDNDTEYATLLLINDDGHSVEEGTRLVALELAFAYPGPSVEQPPSVEYVTYVTSPDEDDNDDAIIHNETRNNGTDITTNGTTTTNTTLPAKNETDDNGGPAPTDDGAQTDDGASDRNDDAKKHTSDATDDDLTPQDKNRWLWLLPVLVFGALAVALCVCRRGGQARDTTVVDATDYDDEDERGVELAHDMKPVKQRRRGGNSYSRVGFPGDDYARTNILEDGEADFV